jgi:hypothetical protein
MRSNKWIDTDVELVWVSLTLQPNAVRSYNSQAPVFGVYFWRCAMRTYKNLLDQHWF